MSCTVDEIVDAVCKVLPLEDKVRLTSTSECREQKMLDLHEALKRSFQALEDISITGFLPQSQCSGVWKCFPALVSYCADITKAKSLCTVKTDLSYRYNSIAV